MSPELPAVSPLQRCREDELLLCCSRSRMGPMTEQRVTQILQEKIDWSSLARQAFSHGVLPLLFWNLNRLCPEKVPNAIRHQLKAASLAIAWWNLTLTEELLRLLNLFRDHEIRALPYKGPVLAAVAYGNLSLRHFGDLDILLPQEDFPKAKELLMQWGYAPKSQFNGDEEVAYLQSHHEYKFVRTSNRLLVELHWGISQWSFAFPFNFDEVWRRREVVPLAGGNVPHLAPEDLLLILCVHGAKHRWGHLRWICDIAELVDAYQGQINWGRLARQARSLGGERMLLLGLFLAHDLFGVVLSKEILKKIENCSQIQTLANQVKTWLFGKSAQTDRVFDEPPFFYWQVRERWRDKLALLEKYLPEYLLRMFIPDDIDKKFFPLPSFLSIGYYFVRPVRLGWKYGSESLRLSSKVQN